MKVGDCFMMAVPPKYDREHLWIVLSNPAADGTVIAVNVTSDVLRAGREFVLQPGIHRRIIHESFVSFSDALCIPVASVTRLSGKLTFMVDPLPTNIVEQIIAVAKAGKSMSEEKRNRI